METPAELRRIRARHGGLLRVLFLNENIGGHTTMHLGLRATIGAHEDVDATFVDVPTRGLLRNLAGAPIPGLAARDLDLQALRSQLALSATARRLLVQRAGTYDVLHVYTQHAALLSVGLLGATPTIVSTDATGEQVARLLPYREPTRWTAMQRHVRRPVERRVYDAATFVVGKSRWCTASLRGAYDVPEEKLHVIPFGVVVPRRVAHPRPEHPIVTFIGASLARKGGDRLLRVYAERLAGRCELHLVTRDRVEERDGVRVHRDLRPGDPRLGALLARTTVLAFPTEMDSFGYAALEVMASGVPVVATRLNALPELVEDGVTGFLVEADDRQLGDALVRVVEDRVLHDRMAVAARERVVRSFDARSTTAQLVDQLFQAVERHHAPQLRATG
jgi:glycosyltransferase involved in cell wall biosynthesis